MDALRRRRLWPPPRPSRPLRRRPRNPSPRRSHRPRRPRRPQWRKPRAICWPRRHVRTTPGAGAIPSTISSFSSSKKTRKRAGRRGSPWPRRSSPASCAVSRCWPWSRRPMASATS
ncbi:MAG: hypothetical protein DMD81_09280 [Candidatus Rokuibacteriota bacterium]|nr:MAG: hypothetical protein DMD81_09280 [Candidatus Rokubacteria bacterium]